MTKKKIIAGNWKMNLGYEDALQLAKDIQKEAPQFKNAEFIIFPSAIYLDFIAKILKNEIGLGAQNCHEADYGAFTGEISCKMIKDIGVQYVLIGHSERRKYFNETNKSTALKVDSALKNKLKPILCCGETLQERQEDNHLEIIGKQVSEALFHLEESEISKVVIAYEPVWAIGTGETAGANQAQEIHAFIRSLVREKYNAHTAQNIQIIYGGSCNAENAGELFKMPDIDGGLIGGASLTAKDFLAIAAQSI